MTHDVTKRFARIVAVLVFATPASADWLSAPDGRLQQRSVKAVLKIRDTIERSKPFFDEAYGYAIFPGITRVGIGFGGAHGKGVVVEDDTVIGTTSYWQLTSGMQIGARNFGMIILFQDKNALDEYKANRLQFMGQAGLSLLTTGVYGSPGYNNGIAVFVIPKLGLMAEFTVSGAKFNFKPLSPPE
jgi:lipid-binding SYLF domain-containing protein